MEDKMDNERLKAKTPARILAMLGSELVTDERIALIELIKNSYDADASWINISFSNLNENYETTSKSKITIRDDGDGMSEQFIKEHWLSPATPEKKIRKETSGATKFGRRMQGEKGIGRFATLRLGKKISITTRTRDGSNEHNINCDFSAYDDEFLSKNGIREDISLSDLPVLYRGTPLPEAKINNSGTTIEISFIKEGSWGKDAIKKLAKDIFTFQSIFPQQNLSSEGNKNIDIRLMVNGMNKLYKEKEFHRLLKDKTVLKITEGKYDEEKREFHFHLNNRINGLDEDILVNFTGEKLRPEIYKFVQRKGGDMVTRKILNSKKDGEYIWKTNCGNFHFAFYIFDFSNKAPSSCRLNKDEKDIIKPYRIYLYRDGIRVYPYGDEEDDWLRIDQYRGSKRAGDFLSNDQVVGVVEITQTGNVFLKDKTSREGLMNIEGATKQIEELLRAFLAYIRSNFYESYHPNVPSKPNVPPKKLLPEKPLRPPVPRKDCLFPEDIFIERNQHFKEKIIYLFEAMNNLDLSDKRNLTVASLCLRPFFELLLRAFYDVRGEKWENGTLANKMQEASRILENERTTEGGKIIKKGTSVMIGKLNDSNEDISRYFNLMNNVLHNEFELCVNSVTTIVNNLESLIRGIIEFVNERA